MPSVTQLLGPPAIRLQSITAGDAGGVTVHSVVHQNSDGEFTGKALSTSPENHSSRIEDAAMETMISQTSNVDLAGKPPGSPENHSSRIEDAAMDTMIAQTKDVDLAEKPPMGLTENKSPTFLATGNPCLDFFFHIVPNTPSDDLIRRLELAWSFDPLTALKLVCNLRGVRGTGKSDKEGFYTSALWLHEHHPKTLALNARVLADFGYFKDFPEILYRIIEGPDVRKIAKEKWLNRKNRKRFSRRRRNRSKFKRQNRGEGHIEEEEEEENMSKGHIEDDDEENRGEDHIEEGKEENRSEDRIEEEERENMEEEEEEEEEEEDMEDVVHVDKETARAMRKEREIAMARKALEKFNCDPKYQFLHNQIADFFAEMLKLDMQHLSSGEFFKISLASKWCPSIDSSFDKATLICESIARRVFPKESYPEYEGIQEDHYAYRVRDRLRKQVLVPLRKKLELPEVYMSANQWGSLPYTRVASVAMKTYKGHFLKHDKERFSEYLENVKSGKAKIAAGALLPHEIVKSLKDEDGGEVAELQWARMVEDLTKKGKLTNCMAICDVSGSMDGIPMEVSVALGLLVSELSEDPWKGKLITFSANPELHAIEGDSLMEKTDFIRRMDWGANTDFQKVFDQILEVAVEGKLSEDEMIKRLFVFSDMEFDQASGNCNLYWGFQDSESDKEDGSYEENWAARKKKMEEKAKDKWETDYQVIQRKFREKGYSKVPEIVFWNLRHSAATPVAANQTGVALLSGFSKNLLTIFLEGGGIVNPVEVMHLAINREEYKKLVLYD